MRAPLLRPLLALAVVAIPHALVAGACTSFDGLAPDDVADAGAAAGPSFLSVAQAATVCGFALADDRVARSLASSIAVPVSTSSFAACMSWLAGPIPDGRAGFTDARDVLRRMASALNAAHALEAVPVEAIDPGDARCAPGDTTRCLDDGRLLDCGGGAVYDCGSALFADLSTCQGRPGAAACAVATCSASSARATCDERAVVGTCDPTTHLLTGRACAALGLDCTAGATGANAACQSDDGPLPCQPGEVTGSTSCDGDRVLVCTSLGTRAIFDCAAVAGTCAQNEPTKRCQREGEECSPFDANQVDTCDGTRLTTCVAGRFVVVECASLGLGCADASGGKSGRCAPLATP
jgi:hypothetical protein